jgi:glutamate--cysteine ligase catalytic subunit
LGILSSPFAIIHSLQLLPPGNGTDFPGLVPLCLRWLDSAGDAPLDVQTHGLIREYLSFVQKRATGECATLARWMREYVNDHSDYNEDSLCPDSTIHDMLKEVGEKWHLFIHL